MKYKLDTGKLDQFLRANHIKQNQLSEWSQVAKNEINKLCLGRRSRPSALPLANIYMALKKRFPALQFEDICLIKDGRK